MKQLFLFLAIFLFPNLVLAQLNQLEFDIDKPVAATPLPVTEEKLKEITGDPLPKNAAEAEAMEKAALEKLKNSQSGNASSAVSSVPVVETNEEEVKKFDYFGGVVPIGIQHGCSSIPPRLKGPFVDSSNDSSITSKTSWPIPKSKDCASIVEEKAFLNKSLALREVLQRFSGNTDYTDLASGNICAKHCNNSALVSDIRIEGANFSVAVAEGACRYILDKPKERPWKMLRAQSLVCSCFDTAKVKAAIDSQVLENK